MCTQVLFYNTVVNPFYKNGSVNVDRKCNGWVVKNTGNTLLTVDQEEIFPGGSKSTGGNFGEIYIGRIDLSFTGGSLIPTQPTARNACLITQKVYTNINLK